MSVGELRGRGGTLCHEKKVHKDNEIVANCQLLWNPYGCFRK